MKTVDIPNMARKLYHDFYSNGRGTASARPIKIANVRPTDLYFHAKSQEADTIVSKVASKKWTVLDADNRIFKIHDSPHNYNVQVKAYRGEDATNDKSVTAAKNTSKLAKYLLSNTRAVVLPIANVEVEKLPADISMKLKTLGVSVPRGTRYSLEFTERFFKSESLKQYLRSGIPPAERKHLMYQVIEALQKCRKAVPGFVHNNISADNITVYQKAPLISRGGSGSSYWKTEVRLSGLDKVTFNGKSPITKDLEAVASIFQGSGGNPDGTAAFLKRMVNQKNYDDILNDEFLAELRDPIEIIGGAKKNSNKKKKKVVLSSPSSDDISSSSLSSTSISSTTVQKKSKRKSMKQHMPNAHQMPAPVRHNPLYNVLNAEEFFKNPTAHLLNPSENPQGMNTPYGQVPNINPFWSSGVEADMMMQQQQAFAPGFQQPQQFLPPQQQFAQPQQFVQQPLMQQPQIPQYTQPDMMMDPTASPVIPNVRDAYQMQYQMSPQQMMAQNYPVQMGGGRQQQHNKNFFF